MAREASTSQRICSRSLTPGYMPQVTPLTPVAVMETKVAASNILKSGESVPDYGGIPTAVFTLRSSSR